MKGEEKMKTIIVAIDHGFGYIKTTNTEFKAGLKEFKDEPPVMSKVVKYKEVYYALGGRRQNVKETKWDDENYWIMTLGAIAEKLGNIQQAEIYLAVGLPLTRFGAEKKPFREYLCRDGRIYFEYQRKAYEVVIKDVLVYPQGYSSIIDRLDSISGMRIICDVGSWTVDVLSLEDGIPNMAKISSLNEGIITAMNNINEELRRLYGSDIEETILQDMVCGKDVQLPHMYKDVINKGLKEYANNILTKLTESGYNIKTTPFIFTGGGAIAIKRYGNYDKDMTSFIEDIHANAKGYEFLAMKQIGADLM